MADTKYPTIRYQTLDRCFRNKYKRFYIEDLIDACSQAIYDYCGKEIGCSRRTILNDIEFMESDAGWGIPLVRHKDGRKVYYRYEDTNFTINETLLSDSELNKLNETLSMLERFKGMPCFEWMDDILFKLQSGFKKSSTAILEFDQAPMLKGMDHLDKLYNAILYKQTLEITYTKYDDFQHVWTIHPYMIKQYNNRWFLFGRNESRYGLISNLPLDRIEKIADSRVPYIADDGTMSRLLSSRIGVTIEKGSKIQDIQLKFSDNRFPYVITKHLHKSQIVINEQDCIIQLTVAPNKELDALILQYGEDVQVLSPESYRDRIKNKIKKMSQLYDQCN